MSIQTTEKRRNSPPGARAYVYKTNKSIESYPTTLPPTPPLPTYYHPSLPPKFFHGGAYGY